MSGVTVFCFLASYAVALGLEFTRLFKLLFVNRVAMILFAGAGLVAHTWYLLERHGQTQLAPLLSSTHDWMLVLAWMAVVFYLFLAVFEPKVPIGIFLLPIVLVLILATYLVSAEPNPLVKPADTVREARHNWAMLHASLLVFGIGGVLVGFVTSMMYLVQHRRLKQKQVLGKDLELPNLERLARINWWAVILTVPMLTLGMLAGIYLLYLLTDGSTNVSFSDPVVVVNGVGWLGMVAFFLWLLFTPRPAGKQVAWMTLWAFGFLLVTMIGLQVLAGRGGLAFDTWHAELQTAPRQTVEG